MLLRKEANVDEDRVLRRAGDVLELLHEMMSGEKRRFMLSLHTNQLTTGPWPGRPEVLSPPPRVSGREASWSWWRAAVFHRVAHTMFGTGVWETDGSEPNRSDSWPVWLVALRERLVRNYPTFGDLYYSVKDREQFAIILEYVEDYRVESQLMAIYRGAAIHISKARDHEVAAMPSLPANRPRALATDFIARGSLELADGSQIPVQQFHTLSAVDFVLGLVATGRRTDFMDSVTVAVVLHRLILDLPLMADEHLPSVGHLPPRASQRALYLARAAADRLRIQPESRENWASAGKHEGEDYWAPVLRRAAYRDVHENYYPIEGSSAPRVVPMLHLFTDAPQQDGLADTYGDTHSHGSVPTDEERGEALRAESPGQLPESASDHHQLGRVPRRIDGAVGDHRFRTTHEAEWDCVDGRYLSGWCRVTIDEDRSAVYGSTSDATGSPSWLVADTELIRPLQALRDWPLEGERWRDGELSGPDVSVDRYIDAWIAQRAEGRRDERFYTAPVRDESDQATICGIDLSLSTARQVEASVGSDTSPMRAPNSGTPQLRTVDCEAKALLGLAHLLDDAGHDFGLFGFSSDSRHDVRITTLLAPGTTRRGPLRLARSSLQPRGATRIAAVIRRLSRLLEWEDTRTRVLIIVCDGRPFDRDYADHHEGDADPLHYAACDTAKALEECEKRGQIVRLLICDPAGRAMLTVVPDRFITIVRAPHELGNAVASLHASLLGGAT